MNRINLLGVSSGFTTKRKRETLQLYEEESESQAIEEDSEQINSDPVKNLNSGENLAESRTKGEGNGIYDESEQVDVEDMLEIDSEGEQEEGEEDEEEEDIDIDEERSDDEDEPDEDEEDGEMEDEDEEMDKDLDGSGENIPTDEYIYFTIERPLTDYDGEINVKRELTSPLEQYLSRKNSEKKRGPKQEEYDSDDSFIDNEEVLSSQDETERPNNVYGKYFVNNSNKDCDPDYEDALLPKKNEILVKSPEIPLPLAETLEKLRLIFEEEKKKLKKKRMRAGSKNQNKTFIAIPKEVYPSLLVCFEAFTSSKSLTSKQAAAFWDRLLEILPFKKHTVMKRMKTLYAEKHGMEAKTPLTATKDKDKSPIRFTQVDLLIEDAGLLEKLSATKAVIQSKDKNYYRVAVDVDGGKGVDYVERFRSDDETRDALVDVMDYHDQKADVEGQQGLVSLKPDVMKERKISSGKYTSRQLLIFLLCSLFRNDVMTSVRMRSLIYRAKRMRTQGKEGNDGESAAPDNGEPLKKAKIAKE